MASFRKRSGRWQARIHQRGFEPIVKSFDLKSDAERWAIAVQRELDLCEYNPKAAKLVTDPAISYELVC